MHCMTERREGLTEAGRWLRERREAADLTQQELAESFGGNTQNVSAYENGLHRPSDSKIAAMARRLGVPVNDMRRQFGLYVAEDAPAEREPDVQDAIRRDPHLIPEARRHLLSQYELLRRLGDPSVTTDSAGLLDEPHAARKRTPRKPRP